MLICDGMMHSKNFVAITHHVNHSFTDIGDIRIADAADVPMQSGRGPGESVIPDLHQNPFSDPYRPLEKPEAGNSIQEGLDK